MQQFIPFEDDWDALETLQPGTLVPYRVGMIPARQPALLLPPATLLPAIPRPSNADAA